MPQCSMQKRLSQSTMMRILSSRHKRMSILIMHPTSSSYALISTNISGTYGIVLANIGYQDIPRLFSAYYGPLSKRMVISLFPASLGRDRKELLSPFRFLIHWYAWNKKTPGEDSFFQNTGAEADNPNAFKTLSIFSNRPKATENVMQESPLIATTLCNYRVWIEFSFCI